MVLRRPSRDRSQAYYWWAPPPERSRARSPSGSASAPPHGPPRRPGTWPDNGGPDPHDDDDWVVARDNDDAGEAPFSWGQVGREWLGALSAEGRRFFRRFWRGISDAPARAFWRELGQRFRRSVAALAILLVILPVLFGGVAAYRLLRAQPGRSLDSASMGPRATPTPSLHWPPIAAPSPTDASTDASTDAPTAVSTAPPLPSPVATLPPTPVSSHFNLAGALVFVNTSAHQFFGPIAASYQGVHCSNSNGPDGIWLVSLTPHQQERVTCAIQQAPWPIIPAHGFATTETGSDGISVSIDNPEAFSPMLGGGQ